MEVSEPHSRAGHLTYSAMTSNTLYTAPHSGRRAALPWVYRELACAATPFEMPHTSQILGPVQPGAVARVHVATGAMQAESRLRQGRKRRAGHEGALADVQVCQAAAQRLQRANACTDYGFKAQIEGLKYRKHDTLRCCG
jgi:hypothetical protein